MERICLIVDFDGFQLKGRPFLVRELGYVSTTSNDCGVASFDLSGVPVYPEDLPTVRYVRRFIHGLPFHPKFDEHARPYDTLDDYILQLYHRYKTSSRDLVAYKGGSCERIKLQQLGVPSVNLEAFGCPKYDVLLQDDDDRTGEEHCCRLHDRSYGGKVFHCALAEVKAFKRWLLRTIEEEQRQRRREEQLRMDEEERQRREEERRRTDEIEGWKPVVGTRRSKGTGKDYLQCKVY